MANIIGSRYETHSDPLTALIIRLFAGVFIDSVKLGRRRVSHLSRYGREWGKANRSWSTTKEITAFLFERHFALGCEELGVDHEVMRGRLIQVMAGTELQVKGAASRCPQCGYVGSTENDFGFRVINGRQYRQSHCKRCRHRR